MVLEHRPKEHPTLRFKFKCSKITQADLVVDHISALDLYCNSAVDNGLAPMLEGIHLTMLPNVEHLVVHRANWVVDADMQVLENWLVLRKSKGCSLCAICFLKCEESIKLFYF